MILLKDFIGNLISLLDFLKFCLCLFVFICVRMIFFCKLKVKTNFFTNINILIPQHIHLQQCNCHILIVVAMSANSKLLYDFNKHNIEFINDDLGKH